MNIAERVESLRAWMRENNLKAFIIPTNDPHNSEYTADYWKCREWISGFNGSAGTAVVTLDDAALWTDSRYFLQAEEQLAGTPFRLMRDGAKDTPSIGKWIANEIDKTIRFLTNEKRAVGFDANVMSYADYAAIGEGEYYKLTPTNDPFEVLWEGRPARPSVPVMILPLSRAGKSAREKLNEVAEVFSERHTDLDMYLINDLSEIAWLLNLRGGDIAYNPLFESYLVYRDEKWYFFIDLKKCTPELKDYLEVLEVELHDYSEYLSFIQKSCKNYFCPIASASINMASYLPSEESSIVSSYVALPKSIKNVDEIIGFRQAMLLDGVALVRFRRWLDEKVADGSIAQETECTISDYLLALRAEHPEFMGLSFATIAGYAAHGAIVHYEAEPETAAQLRNEGLLLLDSGAQYRCGTTDITRTIALGALTDEERKVYTLVLKGHIALSRARFPEGTLGIQLDLAARYAMWQEGYDFGHGTGHGVGSYLCVHEGPQQIRKDLRAATQVPFQAGMTITNEPGIYLAGKFGVRIENVLLTIPAGTTPFGTFLGFETMTLCPIDTAPIALEMLDSTEREWLNTYHKAVCEHLLPLLKEEADRKWLVEATKPL